MAYPVKHKDPGLNPYYPPVGQGWGGKERRGHVTSSEADLRVSTFLSIFDSSLSFSLLPNKNQKQTKYRGKWLPGSGGFIVPTPSAIDRNDNLAV